MAILFSAVSVIHHKRRKNMEKDRNCWESFRGESYQPKQFYSIPEGVGKNRHQAIRSHMFTISKTFVGLYINPKGLYPEHQSGRVSFRVWNGVTTTTTTSRLWGLSSSQLVILLPSCFFDVFGCILLFDLLKEMMCVQNNYKHEHLFYCWDY